MTNRLNRTSLSTQLHARGWFALPLGTFAGFMAAGFAAVIIGIASWTSLNDRAVAAERVSHALDLIAQAQATLSSLKDAETGQRGFLLTGSERYLEPYTAARERLASTLLRLRELSGSDPRQRQRLDALGNAAADKMDELAKTIELRREGKTDEALAIVVTDRGKLAMDRIRVAIERIVGDANTDSLPPRRIGRTPSAAAP